MPVQSIDVILRALNGRRFNQELRAAGKSAQALGRDFGEAGRATSALAAAGNAASGSLYAVSAASRIAAYGIGALSLGVIGLGVQFNSTMEQNELAFKRFVSGGEAGSEAFVKKLIFMAKETPLQLEGITTAARRLFAVQIPESDILKTLQGMADMTAVTGASTDTLLRMSKALGDVHVKGRLMAEEVRQFSNLGVNWRQILDEGGLKLSQKNLENIGRAGITSAEFFEAWYRGSERVFGGASEEYMETFAGQWEKLKDNVKIASGFLTENLFEGLKGQIKDINSVIDPFIAKFVNDEADAGANKLRDTLEGIGKTVGGVIVGGIGLAIAAFTWFMDTVSPAAPFFENVLWPIAKGLFKGIAGGIIAVMPIIKLLFIALGWIGEKLAPLKGVFEAVGMVIGFLFGGVILRAIGLLSKFGFFFTFIGTVAKILAIPLRLLGAIFGFIGGVVLKFLGFLTRFLPISQILKAAFGALGTTIKNKLGGAVGWVFNKLGDMGTKVFWIAKNIGNMFIKGLGNIGKRILGAFTSVGSFIAGIGGGLKDWINDKTIFGDKISLGPLGSITVPALAEGGYVTSGGWALVGERGPELVNLPRQSSVLPNKPAQTRALPSKKMGHPDVINAENAGVSFDAPQETRITKVYIGRRQVAEAVGEEVTQQTARSRGR